MVSRCFPGGYNVKLYISRGRLAWWLLAFFVLCYSYMICKMPNKLSQQRKQHVICTCICNILPVHYHMMTLNPCLFFMLIARDNSNPPKDACGQVDSVFSWTYDQKVWDSTSTVGHCRTVGKTFHSIMPLPT